jgi:hypothetical protein
MPPSATPTICARYVPACDGQVTCSCGSGKTDCACDTSCAPFLLKFTGNVLTTSPVFFADPGSENAANPNPESYVMPKCVVTDVLVDLLTDMTGLTSTVKLNVLKNGSVGDPNLEAAYGQGTGTMTGSLMKSGKVIFAKGDRLDLRAVLSGTALAQAQRFSVTVIGKMVSP